MPIYEYRCERCDKLFEHLVSHCQADCSVILPNMKYAVCSECGDIIPRVMENVNLSLINLTGNYLAAINKKSYDKQFDRVTIDAGKNYGHCITTGNDTDKYSKRDIYIRLDKLDEHICFYCTAIMLKYIKSNTNNGNNKDMVDKISRNLRNRLVYYNIDDKGSSSPFNSMNIHVI